MAKKKKKDEQRPVFDSIRKPTAPPSRKFGRNKPDELIDPTGRRSKHKKKPETENGGQDDVQ